MHSLTNTRMRQRGLAMVEFAIALPLLRRWPRMGRAWLVLAEARFASGDHAGAGDAYQEYVRLTHLDRELEATGAALAQGRLQGIIESYH